MSRMTMFSDSVYTLTVKRGYDNTTASDHGQNAGVYLELVDGTPWSQLFESPIPNNPTKAGLFTLDATYLDNTSNFPALEKTTSASGGAAGGTAAKTAGALSTSPEADPSDDLPATPFAQVTTLDLPQAVPVQFATAIPPMRPEVVDTVFAASGAAGQEQRTTTQGSNLSSDDTDALFAADDPALWGVEVAQLGTGLK